jgi:choline dehydrogenase/5-(hydroxymethyl)furfural/furfural oxidase
VRGVTEVISGRSRREPPVGLLNGIRINVRSTTEDERHAAQIETDWLVVGGCSAGCVLAARLSDDPAREILLFEAGPDWRERGATGAAQPQRLAGVGRVGVRAFQWQGFESRRTRVREPRQHVRGRGLGGGSTVNGMMAIQAIPDDYERWAAFGCPGRSYAEMLPYRRRMESDADFGDRPCHGADGPLPIRRLPRSTWGPADNALADAALGLGYAWCDDHNAPTATGVAPFGLNARDGARVTTNDAYLEPNRERPNLRVVGARPSSGCSSRRSRRRRPRQHRERLGRGAGRARRAVRRGDPLAVDPPAFRDRP